MLVVAVVALVVAVTVSGVALVNLRRDQRGADDAPARSGCVTGAAVQDAAGCMPAQAPAGWRRVYGEDFASPVPLGGFTTSSPDDWELTPTNPYARSLRSYPDGWGTTNDYALNYASRTTDVAADEFGARGVLRLYAHSEQVEGRTRALAGSFFTVPYPDAATSDRQTGQRYGRYSVRFRTVGGAGAPATPETTSGSTPDAYGTSFILWPVDDRWETGEINFPEMAWGAPISGFVHQIGRPATNADQFELAATSDGWHTATIEWYPGALAFYLDQTLVRRVDHDVPDVPMRFGFQSGGDAGVPAPSTEGYLLVDWVTVEAHDGAVPPTAGPAATASPAPGSSIR